MSDTHAWPAAPTVDAAMSVLRAYRDQVRGMARTFDSDDPRRDLAVAMWGSLGEVEEQMRHLLSRPVAARHEPGLDTGAWTSGVPGSLRRNQRLP